MIKLNKYLILIINNIIKKHINDLARFRNKILNLFRKIFLLNILV